MNNNKKLQFKSRIFFYIIKSDISDQNCQKSSKVKVVNSGDEHLEVFRCKYLNPGCLPRRPGC